MNNLCLLAHFNLCLFKHYRPRLRSYQIWCCGKNTGFLLVFIKASGNEMPASAVEEAGTCSTFLCASCCSSQSCPLATLREHTELLKWTTNNSVMLITYTASRYTTSPETCNHLSQRWIWSEHRFSLVLLMLHKI